jgi:hypothetical protein
MMLNAERCSVLPSSTVPVAIFFVSFVSFKTLMRGGTHFILFLICAHFIRVHYCTVHFSIMRVPVVLKSDLYPICIQNVKNLQVFFGVKINPRTLVTRFTLCPPCVQEYLPFILHEIETQPRRQYLLLHSLKEVISAQSASPTGVQVSTRRLPAHFQHFPSLEASVADPDPQGSTSFAEA